VVVRLPSLLRRWYNWFEPQRPRLQQKKVKKGNKLLIFMNGFLSLARSSLIMHGMIGTTSTHYQRIIKRKSTLMPTTNNPSLEIPLADIRDPLPRPSIVGAGGKWSRVNKGDLSNVVTFFIMVVGLVLRLTLPEEDSAPMVKYVLALGLFGFAGGVTNWLAVKMLFDRIPYLYGSGVIPRQFVAIRTTVKETIMMTFFDEEYLTRYLNERAAGLAEKMNLSAMIKEKVNEQSFDANLGAKLTELSTKPEGAMVAMMVGM